MRKAKSHTANHWTVPLHPLDGAIFSMSPQDEASHCGCGTDWHHWPCFRYTPPPLRSEAEYIHFHQNALSFSPEACKFPERPDTRTKTLPLDSVLQYPDVPVQFPAHFRFYSVSVICHKRPLILTVHRFRAAAATSGMHSRTLPGQNQFYFFLPKPWSDNNITLHRDFPAEVPDCKAAPDSHIFPRGHNIRTDTGRSLNTKSDNKYSGSSPNAYLQLLSWNHPDKVQAPLLVSGSSHPLK